MSDPIGFNPRSTVISTPAESASTATGAQTTAKTPAAPAAPKDGFGGVPAPMRMDSETSASGASRALTAPQAQAPIAERRQNPAGRMTFDLSKMIASLSAEQRSTCEAHVAQWCGAFAS